MTRMQMWYDFAAFLGVVLQRLVPTSALLTSKKFIFSLKTIR